MRNVSSAESPVMGLFAACAAVDRSPSRMGCLRVFGTGSQGQVRRALELSWPDATVGVAAPIVGADGAAID